MITLTLILLCSLLPATVMSIQTIIISHILMNYAKQFKMNRVMRVLNTIDKNITYSILRLVTFYGQVEQEYFLMHVRAVVDNRLSAVYSLYCKSPIYKRLD